MPASGASLLLNAEGVFTALMARFALKEDFDRSIAFGILTDLTLTDHRGRRRHPELAGRSTVRRTAAGARGVGLFSGLGSRRRSDEQGVAGRCNVGGDVKDWLRPSASSAAASAAPPRARRRSCPYQPAAESACRSCPPPDPNGPRGATAHQRRASSDSRGSPCAERPKDRLDERDGTVCAKQSARPARSPISRSASWMDASETTLDSLAT